MLQDILDIYTDYLICQNQHATALGLSNLLEGELGHDRITRFLNRNEYSSKDLWQYVKSDVRQYEQTTDWFRAKDNMEFVHYDIKRFFVFGIKANRLIAFSEEERKKGQYHNLNSLNFKDGEKRTVWLKDLAFPVALVTNSLFVRKVSLKYKLILKANQMAFRELKI